MLFSTAPRWCSSLAVATSRDPIFSPMRSLRCLYQTPMFCDSFNLSVVCCNHSERLEHLLPLSGEVRALQLLPKMLTSMHSAGHPSSRRRGACSGIAGTVRVCLCLSCCLRWLRAFAWCAGVNSWMARFGDGALGVAGCNDQLLALVLCLELRQCV